MKNTTERLAPVSKSLKTYVPRLFRSRLLWPILIYFLLSALAYWPVQPLSSSHVVTCGCFDIVEQSWFLAWTPHAILNGINPFFTHALNYPYGANLASNTTMPLLGILSAPITLILGPISSFNLLIRLAFALSATSMFLVLRRYVPYQTIAFIGGLLYGFSPFMIAQGSLHLNLTFVPLFPLMLVCLDNLILKQKHSPRRDGLTLGLLVTAQYFISSELLADFVLMCLIAVIILAAFHLKEARERFTHVASGLIWSFVPLVLIAGYPIVFSIKGPEHVVVVTDIKIRNEAIKAHLLSPIVPTSHQLLGSAYYKSVGNKLIPSPGENGAYVGIPLLLVSLLIVFYSRRQRSIRYFAIMAVAAFVLSLGPRLYIDNSNIWLPFSLVDGIRLASIEVPSRYFLFVFLSLSFLLSLGLADIYRRLHELSSKKKKSSGIAKLPMIVVIAIATVSFLPLLPSLPYKSARVNMPKYFLTSSVNKIPAGSTVLSYPYPITGSNFSMLWQAQSGFRFNLLGGYVLIPLQTSGPPGVGLGGLNTPWTLNPALIQVMFEEGYSGVPHGVQPPPPLPWAFAQVEGFIHSYKVSTVVVWHTGADPRLIDNFFTAMFGKPVKSGKLDIWYNVSTRKVLTPQ
ncbi:MAG: hypothetical protein M1374_08765 [Firmicutes bacterium]|nr:hypothetical protein [Bacillota bacterium]